MKNKFEHEAGQEIATFAGGCFWGMEDLIRKIPGVVSTEVGYTGGTIANPTYELVKKGQSGHAEALQIIFDPMHVTYEKLLEFFFRMHDPTTLNRQGGDIGSQYRSAIFYHTEQQKISAELYKVKASDKWKNPAVTEIQPATGFYPAESYHQDYLLNNPNGYTCHWLRNW